MIHIMRIISVLHITIFLASIYAAKCNDKSYVIGIDCGTESARVGLFCCQSGELIGSESARYQTNFPQPGYAEQNPEDWWNSIGTASQQLKSKLKIGSEDGIPFDLVKGMAMDTTCCSVVALDANFKPLRPCLLWMDARSSDQTTYMMEKAKGDPALSVNCGGDGPVSAEWMIPKALWLKQKEYDTWSKSRYICEKQDFLNYKLSGRLCASGCNVAVRWHWNAEEACTSPLSPEPPSSAASIASTLSKGQSLTKLFPGRPVSLLQKLGLLDLLWKWPYECVPMGYPIGGLTSDAANHLGLPKGLPVIQGGPDAYVGMIGLGAIKPGALALITGSSHLHLSVCGAEVASGKGFWGPYRGAPLLGLNFVEGGQSSTGSVLTWTKRLFQGNSISEPSFEELDLEAARIPVGSEGLLSLSTFQGARTPKTDPRLRGALVGLSLAHSRGHIWRAMLEGVCLGTRAAFEALETTGALASRNSPLGTIHLAGGTARSPFWLQMHADVVGRSISLGASENSPLLGAAVLAAAATEYKEVDSSAENNVGKNNMIDGKTVLERVEKAVIKMVKVNRTLKADENNYHLYSDEVYPLYQSLAASVEHVSHGLVDLELKKTTLKQSKPSITSQQPTLQPTYSPSSLPCLNSENKRDHIIMPSILAGDYGFLSLEAAVCKNAGAKWIHIDICDGNSGSPGSLTIGPQSVKAIHDTCPDLLLDVHVVSDDILSLIEPLALAGTTRLTFQLELLDKLDIKHFSDKDLKGDELKIEKIRFIVEKILSQGIQVGVCISPNTDVKELDYILSLTYEDILNKNSNNQTKKNERIINYVDILAVLPGIGGQSFNISALEKVEYLRKYYPSLDNIAVDGGINKETGLLSAKSGANILIAGSSIFGKNRKLNKIIKDEKKDKYVINLTNINVDLIDDKIISGLNELQDIFTRFGNN